MRPGGRIPYATGALLQKLLGLNSRAAAPHLRASRATCLAVAGRASWTLKPAGAALWKYSILPRRVVMATGASELTLIFDGPGRWDNGVVAEVEGLVRGV